MPLPPSSPLKELLGLYSQAQHGEYNIGEFLQRHPDLCDRLGVLDITRDDAELALQLAGAVGRYKTHASKVQRDGRTDRAGQAARRLVGSARRDGGRVVLDVDLLLGDLLADASRKYICFELDEACVDVHRHALVRARVPMRSFHDVLAYVDPTGLHLRWRAGRGGLNLQPQQRDRGAPALLVDLRAPAEVLHAHCRQPVRVGDILADMAFI